MMSSLSSSCATADGVDQPAASGVGRALALVWAVTFVFALAGLHARATYGTQLTADEPQYLLSALSLGEDADLDISDELAEERFRDFHEIALNPQTIELNDSGQRLSPHDPGLPLLLAGPMTVGGWRLAKASLAVIAGVTAAITAWVAIRRFAVGVGTAAVVTISLFATPPLTGYATQVYPEMPAALTVILATAALSGASTRALSVANRLIALAAVIALPWLAVKYVPVAAILALALILAAAQKVCGWRRSALAIAVPIGVLTFAGALYLIAHQRIYGGWTVYATGDHFVDGEFLVVGDDPDYLGRSRRLIGLLVDRSFGLIAWAPAFLMLFPALAALARRRLPGALLIGSALAAGWAVATWVALTMHGWWWPGRQVVVVLPVAVVALAVFVDRRPWLLRILVGASLLSALNWLWLVVEASTGRRALIVDFTETTGPLYRLWATLLPDHRTPEGTDTILTIVWTAALALLAWLAWRDAARQGRAKTDQAAEAPETNPAGSAPYS